MPGKHPESLPMLGFSFFLSPSNHLHGCQDLIMGKLSQREEVKHFCKNINESLSS